MNQYINHPRTWWSSLFHREEGKIRARKLIEDAYSLKTTVGIDLLIKQEITHGSSGNRDSSLKTILKNTMEKNRSIPIQARLDRRHTRREHVDTSTLCSALPISRRFYKISWQGQSRRTYRLENTFLIQPLTESPIPR